MLTYVLFDCDMYVELNLIQIFKEYVIRWIVVQLHKAYHVDIFASLHFITQHILLTRYVFSAWDMVLKTALGFPVY